jgi:hypothetical protein
MEKMYPRLLLVSKMSVLGHAQGSRIWVLLFLNECIVLFGPDILLLCLSILYMKEMIEMFDIIHRIFVVTIFHCARNEEAVNTRNVSEVC